MTDRIILHLDMNAFFASVEQQANPALRGKPIAVIGSNGRTVITTASYEARKFGVKTGMAIWEAKRQCPKPQSGKLAFYSDGWLGCRYRNNQRRKNQFYIQET
jgi:nucleotidyltransferase/DNA polymerase involved in DNA repair